MNKENNPGNYNEDNQLITKPKHNRVARYEYHRWMIFGVTYLAYVGYYFTRKSFPVAKVGILQDPLVDIGTPEMGVIDMVFGIAYAIGQFLWGMAGDRFGPRYVVLTGMLCSVVVAVLMGLSSHFIFFGILFFLQGLSQASGWAPLAKNVGNWFSRAERGRIYGFWATNYAVGGMVASAFAGYMAVFFGDWRFAFFMPALVLFIISVTFFFIQKNTPQDAGLSSIEKYHGEPEDVITGKDKSSKGNGFWEVIRGVLSNPMILRLGAVYFFLKPIRYAILFWGPVIMYQTLGTGIGESALISAFFEFSGPLGVIAAGYASDKFFRSRRIPVIVIGLLILSIILFFFNYITAGGSAFIMMLTLAAIGFFLFGPDSLISATSSVDFGTKKGAGSAAGIINGMGSVGQILGMALPGLIADLYGWDTLFNGMGFFILIAALIMIPKWNAVPATAENNVKNNNS